MRIKTLKWPAIFIVTLLLGITIYLYWYTANPHTPSSQMIIAVKDLKSLEIENHDNHLSFVPDAPTANIVLVPGGLVEASAYSYLAGILATKGYQTTIVKPFRNLAILSSQQPMQYLKPNLPNVLLGHSLGGTVAAMNAQASNEIDALILLASYTTTQVDVPTLSIIASLDTVLDSDAYNHAKQNYTDGFHEYVIDGGNHAQFGWYGVQQGDSEATILVEHQHQAVANEIYRYLSSQLFGEEL